ncbi:hypothetical protein [Kitasatospora cineracea]|uniref:hypothetical protein n=1 Tax=Kitasatospora cineracea TaxID=88074 RepID=UPI0037FE94D9
MPTGVLLRAADGEPARAAAPGGDAGATGESAKGKHDMGEQQGNRAASDTGCGAGTPDSGHRTAAAGTGSTGKGVNAVKGVGAGKAVKAVKAVTAGKYARVERERRFLLDRLPAPGAVTVARRITDRYVEGTRLRLRRVERLDTGECTYKLTQKVPAPPGEPGAVQGLVTNLYLSEQEYARLRAALPGPELTKTRLSVPPLGVDVFEGPLLGLVLAEAEFETAEDAETFVPPPGCVAELTDDRHFTGGRLVRTDREELRDGLAGYGVALP